MNHLIETILTIIGILIFIAFFYPKIGERLNLKRIRNSCGLLCLLWGITILQMLLHEITTRDIIIFAVGVIVGVPFEIFITRSALKRVKANILYSAPEGKGWIYIFVLLLIGIGIGIGISIGIRYGKISEAQIELFWRREMWIFLFPSMVASFLEIVRHEKQYGAIYIKIKKKKCHMPNSHRENRDSKK